MNNNNILAVVLAGGKSSRFGKDKSSIKLGDKTLLEHTLEKLKNNFDKIIIVSNNKLDTEHEIIEDCIKGQLGPLVGVLSAMKYIVNNKLNFKWVATFPCDTPFFDNKAIDDFKKVKDSDNQLLYFLKSKEKRHNIFGLWSIKLLKTLEEDLVKNNFRKVEVWADKVGVSFIEINYKNYDTFLNINKESDLLEAEKILKLIQDDKLQ